MVWVENRISPRYSILHPAARYKISRRWTLTHTSINTVPIYSKIKHFHYNNTGINAVFLFRGQVTGTSSFYCCDRPDAVVMY